MKVNLCHGVVVTHVKVVCTPGDTILLCGVSINSVERSA